MFSIIASVPLPDCVSRQVHPHALPGIPGGISKLLGPRARGDQGILQADGAGILQPPAANGNNI